MEYPCEEWYGLYAIVKDFAGPVATIIASATAAIITYRFGSQHTG
jgi:hypothetical protein